ncbi:hypothetical protein J4573_33295 [Actinomadura barringtoniae]|uniref:Lipoprotein n=1 Tax=Actinomadura barringtoniae TaxID=1427535 RepID=A0A939T6J0_9ACTN|nr:hypothetical protein [Actinomadura barringtoniae]MBO2452003.1 hypothetical protein [Actinomadura barringtoniae]
MTRKATGAAVAVLAAATTLMTAGCGAHADGSRVSAQSVAAASKPKPKPRCIAGTWQLTKTAGRVKGPDSLVTFAGGQGTRLHVSKGVSTYDFRRSGRMTENGKKGKAQFGMWLKYDKTLRLKSGYSGNAKGTLGLQTKTASGTATVNGRIVRPAPFPLKKQALAPLIKKGKTDQALLPLAVSYTCTPKALHLHQAKKAKGGYTTVADWWFKRVGR